MTIEHTFKKLSCNLTPVELDSRAQDMAGKQRDKEDKEARKKDLAAKMGEEIKTLDSEISRLAREIRNKSEDRRVKCWYQRSMETGMMLIVREDTGEVVARRPLTDDELQIPMLGLTSDVPPTPKDVDSTEQGEDIEKTVPIG